METRSPYFFISSETGSLKIHLIDWKQMIAEWQHLTKYLLHPHFKNLLCSSEPPQAEHHLHQNQNQNKDISTVSWAQVTPLKARDSEIPPCTQTISMVNGKKKQVLDFSDEEPCES